MVHAPEGGKGLPGTVKQNLNVIHCMTKGEEEDEDVIIIDGVGGGDWCGCCSYETSNKQVVHEGEA